MTVVVVTGGSGFVGSRVIAEFKRKGYDAVSLDRTRPSEEDVGFVHGDITDPGSFDIPKDTFAVVHCAGLLESSHPGAGMLEKVNYEGTKVVYTKSREAGVGRFVFMSTVMALGPRGSRDRPMKEDDTPRPDEPYGSSKLKAERFLRERGEADGTVVTILRPPVIYGEGMSPNSSAMKTFLNVRKGTFPLVQGGRNVFNMLYVGNLAQAICLAVERCDRTRTFHVNEGPYTTKQVADTIKDAMGVKKGYFRVPKWTFYLLSRAVTSFQFLFRGPPPLSMTKYRALSSDIWSLDSTRIRTELGYHPSVSLEEGVERVCRHYGWVENTI